jgi:hypothetical protein
VNLSLHVDNIVNSITRNNITNNSTGGTHGVHFASGASSRREQYILTSDGLSSRRVRLNGGDWLTSADDLIPKQIPASNLDLIAAPGYSLGFIILPDAHAPACIA